MLRHVVDPIESGQVVLPTECGGEFHQLGGRELSPQFGKELFGDVSGGFGDRLGQSNGQRFPRSQSATVAALNGQNLLLRCSFCSAPGRGRSCSKGAADQTRYSRLAEQNEKRFNLSRPRVDGGHEAKAKQSSGTVTVNLHRQQNFAESLPRYPINQLRKKTSGSVVSVISHTGGF